MPPANKIEEDICLKYKLSKQDTFFIVFVITLLQEQPL